MRFHVVALPHTQTSKRHNACAYTQKVLNFCKMMNDLGHTVFHYGAEGSNPPCTEHVDIITAGQQLQFFGPFDPLKLYHIEWNPRLPYWDLCNRNAAAEILRRHQQRDIVCLIAGLCQQPIVEMLPAGLANVEYGIGYTGTFSKHRIFESYAQLHKIWGSENLDRDGGWYDAVIPNYYDPADFRFVPTKKNYLLYIGRLIRRKGIEIAVQVAKANGAKLIIAGQGALSWDPATHTLVTAEGVYQGEHLDYFGVADVEQRAKLMGEARAVLVPTLYVEPFGGVNVESQMCGTPVITSDWGAFPETVLHGTTGFRCRTFDQFVRAAEVVGNLKPREIRAWAIRRYSLKAVAKQYHRYFQMIDDLWHEGWYRRHDLATALDFLG